MLLSANRKTSTLDSKLNSYPTFRELVQAVNDAVQHRGSRVRLFWPNPITNGEYCLTIQVSFGKNAPCWQLHSLVQKRLEIVWSRVTCEILAIHKLIESTCALPGQNASKPAAIAVHDLKNLFEENEAQEKAANARAARTRMHKQAVQDFKQSLMNERNGLLKLPALLFLLEQEQVRSRRAKSSVSLLLVRLGWTKSATYSVSGPLDPQQMNEAVKCIGTVKRETDLMGEYHAGDLAILLPNTTAAGAKLFIRKLITALQETRLPGMTGSDRLLCSIGLASIPGDCSDVQGLLDAAESTLAQSQQQELPTMAVVNQSATHLVFEHMIDALPGRIHVTADSLTPG